MPRLGSALIHYQSVTSTNDVARDLALAGAPEGAIIIADEQTAGRGRQGRSWTSRPGEGLYLSAVLRPRIPAGQSPILALVSAVAVAETLSLDFEIAADIKWPNDVLASGRKICGILVESAIEGERLTYVVVGIGVNLTQREFPDEIREHATSLLRESGLTVSSKEFAARLLPRLDAMYQMAMSNPPEIVRRWETRSTYARGRAVRIFSPDGVLDGTTRGLTENGALVLETDKGEIREIVSGEVTLRPAE